MADEKINSLMELASLISDNRSESDVKDEKMEIIKELLKRQKVSRSNITIEDKTELLKKRFNAFTEINEFVVGDLVKWKPGLRNKGTIEYDEVAIVVEVLDPPIYDEEKGAGSPYYREPLNLVLAFLDSDNDFITFHTDKRRFMPA